MVETIVTEGLIYGIMTLGVFITFRVLDFADLTVDGTFPLGGAVMAFCLLRGVPPGPAFLAAFAGGALGGLATALIHTNLRVPGLLAGILTMTMLYSVNLRIMDNKANITYLKMTTPFSSLQAISEGVLPEGLAVLLFVFIASLVLKALLDLFFHTDFGLTMGALGSNPQLVISQGMNPEIIKGVGICLANALVALSGAFASLYNGFADVGAGNGMVVSGLASVMLGEFLLRSNSIAVLTLRALLGSIIYRALMFAARIHGWRIGMSPNDFKLVTGILIILCLISAKADLRSLLMGRKKREGPC
ncbi:MAG: ABC transporter permease [Spirochaetaceae bacterium]|jgi:putative ABC transport system permease protein|nr:ABC transporter permease [Spirochaetaceae bacterium]